MNRPGKENAGQEYSVFLLDCMCRRCFVLWWHFGSNPDNSKGLFRNQLLLYKTSLMTKLESCIKQLRTHLMDTLKDKGRGNFLRHFL